MNRRAFLGTSAIALASFAGTPTATARDAAGFDLGAQSYSFRNFDMNGAIAQLRSLGLNSIEFCAVHFPADPDNPKLEEIKAAIASAGVTVPCYGVEGFSKDEAANRKKFEFAKALGIGILTADPEPDSFDVLDKLVEEYQIKIAIHNHGPKARYDKVADTISAVQGHHAFIGACVDTGHVIRSGEKPHEVIEALGDRVISLHLKDWIHGGAEQILGKGDMDLAAVAKALRAVKFDGPLMMEYEEHPDDPAPHMKEGMENWEAAAK
ncbi:MAG: hypothetical protein AMXMBFR84_25130 [Candidatus Hydrogenedentota bacterium]